MCSAITSLDGYVADEDGHFDWFTPDKEAHAFINDFLRPAGAYLYGRRKYEVMVLWEAAHTLSDQRRITQDFARIWQATDKVVYSKQEGQERHLWRQLLTKRGEYMAARLDAPWGAGA